MDQIELRNRLLVATGMWRDATGEPLPRMSPGAPEDQIREFELTLVNRLWETATPENAREVADRTWDLVPRPARRGSGQAPGGRVPRGTGADAAPKRLTDRTTWPACRYPWPGRS